MATSNFYQVTLNKLVGAFSGNDMTHETVAVTVTATMKNGSLLLANGTEAAKAAAATVVGYIDSTAFNGKDYQVGDIAVVDVAKRNVKADSTYLTFSDGAYAAETLTLLNAAGVILA